MLVTIPLGSFFQSLKKNTDFEKQVNLNLKKKKGSFVSPWLSTLSNFFYVQHPLIQPLAIANTTPEDPAPQ